MGSRITGLAVVSFAVGCSAVDAAPAQSASEVGPPSVAPEQLVRREDVERDLVLTLRRHAPEPFETSLDPLLEAVLSNRSKTRSYPVVLPHRETNTAESYVFYTVERRSSSSSPWEPAPPLSGGNRCGVYEAPLNIVSLAPGKELVLPPYDFYAMWDFEEASHARIVAHFVGDRVSDMRRVPPELHTMPAFELASNALERAIDPPLVLELKWRGTLPDENAPLARSFEVVAVNRGEQSLPFATADSGSVLRIDLEGEEADGAIHRHEIETGISVGDATDQIAPGSRRNVVGSAIAHAPAPEDAPPRDFRPRRAHASLRIQWKNEATGETYERTARSPWVTGSP
jgi:hypothetical protein